MAKDIDETVTEAPQAPVVPRPVLLAGIAVACGLGVGAGLWARPADLDQPTLGRPMAAARPSTKLQIELVQDPSAPPRPKLDAPVAEAMTIVAAAPAPVIVKAAPLTPPAGLLKARAVELEPAKPAVVERPKPVESAPLKATPVKVHKPEAEPAKPKLERTKAESPPKAERRLVVAEKREPPAKAKTGKAKTGKAKTGKAIDAAETEKAQAKAPSRLARLGKALAKVAPARTKETEAAKLAKVEASPERAKPKAEKPASKLAKAEPKPAPAQKPVKLARTSKRCTSSDPGAAIVCADPALGAADRQMARAYQEAEAAGVPASRLKQQQQRWLSARAAAAREAPWAVHDVYLARIAELKDLTRDARQGY